MNKSLQFEKGGVFLAEGMAHAEKQPWKVVFCLRKGRTWAWHAGEGVHMCWVRLVGRWEKNLERK